MYSNVKQRLTKENSIRIGIILAIYLLVFTDFIDIIFTFLLVGIIPGTHVIIPYWVMMLGYCILITIIVTPYIERFLKARHEKQLQVQQQARRTARQYASIRS